MLLDVEMAIRIKPAQWDPSCPSTSDGIGCQLCHQRTDRDTGLSQAEKLVQATSNLQRRQPYPFLSSYADAPRATGKTYNCEQNSDHPHANGINRQVYIILRPHGRPYFWEGRIIGFEGEDLGCITVTQDGEVMLILGV